MEVIVFVILNLKILGTNKNIYYFYKEFKLELENIFVFNIFINGLR